MKKQQSQGKVDNPTSLEQPQLSQWSRRKSEGQRVMKTYLLALMPSLRVAKPSATRDSAMFSPLVSEEKKRELNTRFKSASNDNRAQMKPTFILTSKTQRPINLFLGTLFLSFLYLSQAKGNSITTEDWQESNTHGASTEYTQSTDLGRKAWNWIHLLPSNILDKVSQHYFSL